MFEVVGVPQLVAKKILHTDVSMALVWAIFPSFTPCTHSIHCIGTPALSPYQLLHPSSGPVPRIDVPTPIYNLGGQKVLCTATAVVSVMGLTVLILPSSHTSDGAFTDGSKLGDPALGGAAVVRDGRAVVCGLVLPTHPRQNLLASFGDPTFCLMRSCIGTIRAIMPLPRALRAQLCRPGGRKRHAQRYIRRRGEGGSEGGGEVGPPPPRVPLSSPLKAGQEFLSLNPLGTEGAKVKFWLLASNIGRGGGGKGVPGGGGDPSSSYSVRPFSYITGCAHPSPPSASGPCHPRAALPSTPWDMIRDGELMPFPPHKIWTQDLIPKRSHEGFHPASWRPLKFRRLAWHKWLFGIRSRVGFHQHYATF